MSNDPKATKPSEPTREDQIAFLGRDFDEAFSEKRRLEDQIWDICKFSFTAHSTLIGLAVGAYRYSLDRKPDLVPAAIVVLAITLAVGVFCVFLMVRARVYFVAVSRYINEQRAYFFHDMAIGFQNKTGFYTDPTKPPYFSWASSQTCAALLGALFNAAGAGTLAFLLARSCTNQTTYSALGLVAIFLLQVLTIRAYLRAKEGSTATDAAWGKHR